MNRNVGGIDRSIRIILGIVFLIVGIFSQLGTTLKTALFVAAAIAFTTAFIGF